MYMPQLSELSVSRDMINQFGGYNHTLSCRQNEFYDMQNMTSTYYPVISPRDQRGFYKTIQKPHGIFAKNALCWVDGTGFYYDGVKRGTVTDTDKQFIGMGAYILIWPDKCYYNTHTGEFGQLAAFYTSSGSVSVSLARADGSKYENYITSTTAPTDPTDGVLWLDTSQTPNILKQYSATTGMFVAIPTTYIRFSATGIGLKFNVYDGVAISGCTNQELNSDYVLQAVDDNYITVIGMLNVAFTQTAALKVERKVPDLDYMTESGNRVWGCSSKNHEIYACKQGDPKNWYCYAGIASDSYAATIGSDGDFTGAATHLGYVLFFKEHCIHRVYGSKPANFQITDIHVRGVEPGSEKSLVIVNETLYYKSRDGICAFDGSLPVSISTQLGYEVYSNAVAGSAGGKYYVSMQDAEGQWTLFTYDDGKGIWCKEDQTHATGFARLGNDLYYLNATDNGIYTTSGMAEGNVGWYAITGDIGVDLPDYKYISKIQLRLSIDTGATLNIFLQYDNEGIWHKKASLRPSGKRSFTVPILTPRCDHMRIKLEGTGGCKIYSISKVIEQGSEL